MHHDLPNEIYYFDVAQGRWRGEFAFAITAFHAFRRERLALRNRALALVLHVAQKVAGPAAMRCVISGDRIADAPGVMHVTVTVRKLGLTLYAMRGEYRLAADGIGVAITLHERFGPIPFLLRNTKQATAEIDPGGMSSTYHMPLLGSNWTGKYAVSTDRNHLRATYTSAWGQARETMSREGL